jgi:hypothetical protein
VNVLRDAMAVDALDSCGGVLRYHRRHGGRIKAHHYPIGVGEGAERCLELCPRILEGPVGSHRGRGLAHAAEAEVTIGEFLARQLTPERNDWT